jgi:hypothetical protein
LWRSKAHWQPAKGTPKENERYCQKDSNVIIKIGFNKDAKTQEKRGKHNYWNNVGKDAKALGAEEFAERWPKEWLIRRGPVEGLMFDASKERMRVWDGKRQYKNVWLWGKQGSESQSGAHARKGWGNIDKEL